MNRTWNAIVCSALARHLRVPPARFKPAQRLREDWNLCPFDLVTVALELEDVESIDFPIAGLHDTHTVGDLVTLLSNSPERRLLRSLGEGGSEARQKVSARRDELPEG